MEPGETVSLLLLRLSNKKIKETKKRSKHSEQHKKTQADR